MRRGEAAKIEPCILQNTKWSKTGQEACKFKEKTLYIKKMRKESGKEYTATSVSRGGDREAV